MLKIIEKSTKKREEPQKSGASRLSIYSFISVPGLEDAHVPSERP